MTEESAVRPHVVLVGSRRAHRPGAEVLGRADPHEWCEITVKLRRAAEIPEPVAGKAVLSDADAVRQHGARAADMDTVEKVLTSYGLTILSKDQGARSIKAAGSVDAMEKAFAVHLLRVKHGTHLYRGRLGPLHIPKELDGIVVGVFGLDTRPMAHRGRRGGDSRGNRFTLAARTPAEMPPPQARPWFLPQELAAAYEFPDNEGAGQTVGIIELAGHYIPSDLEKFASLAGIGAPPDVVVKNVETLSRQDRNDPDAVSEVMLDIEVVAAVCPKSTIAVYFSNFTEKGWIDVIDAALNDTRNRPSVLSISYGLAEGTEIWTDQAMSAINDSFKEAAARGIPVCISAGDDGSDDQVQDGMAHIDFPAASPFVLAIGGTAMMKAGGRPAGEVVWFDGDGLRRDGGGSTGGGVSTVIERPDWQKEIDISPVNRGALTGRIIPDVAAVAAGSTGYLIVANGNPEVSGGTSAAAPLWAGLIARLNAAGKPLHYATPLFYQANARTGGRPLGEIACNDITKGNNVTAAIGGFHAGPGYDAATGWGTPNGKKLMQFL
jgi:kumamolisin